MSPEIYYSIALTKVRGLSLINTKILYETFGSATAFFENRNDIKSFIPDASPRLIEAVQNVDYALKRAEEEVEFVEKKSVKVLTMNDEAYPQRLKECDDAPIALYFCGNGDLNKAKVVSMVGTRKITEYGKELCDNFVSELKQYYPDTLIVSGLAYGVDIHSHRAALANDMDTVGVLAHGLDRIYPAVHRQTAVEMVKHGGLLTEYLSGTNPDKGNFVARNRIVAGMCDACIVVQSAKRGGSLITANLAQAYNRELFTFPGRINDEFSAGCNRLIQENKATLITNAEDFINAVGWPNTLSKSKSPIQHELFINLSNEEQLIVDTLKGCDEKPINMIVSQTDLSYSRVITIMFELEMKGLVKVLGGTRYKLTRNI